MREHRSPIRGTIQPIEDPSMDRLCDLCEEAPAIEEGIEYRETFFTPAEWLAICAQCMGGPV